jgi:hypothetical protein
MIHREDGDWGVALRVAPFAHSGGLKAMMRIDVDIRKPDGRRGPQIKVFFHSTAYADKYLSGTEARTWGLALNAILDEADKVAEAMRSEGKRPKKRTGMRGSKADDRS